MFAAYFLAGVSFLTISAIALDRYLAVILHLRHQSLVTDKRVRAGLAILWLATGLVSFTVIFLPNHSNLVIVLVQSLGYAVTTLAYLRIYRVVRHHQNQVHSQSQIQNDQAMKAAREKKSALNAFYVYIISLSCYLPSTFSVILLEVNRSQISFISTAYVAFS